ncbi:MAG: hypothetical protein FJW69_01700 [Actinobacteria bacterium]|nr:hypothetical protein [Actinomycetota bacterium]
MKSVLNATDVRKNWSSFIDDVKWKRPALVKRNRDILTVLPVDLMENMLAGYMLTVDVCQEDDGSYTGVFKEIDLAANSKDMDSLEAELAKELIDYSEDYLNDFRFYYENSNRKSHFPYVFRVYLLSDDIDKVKKIFSSNIKIKKKVS